MNKSLKTETREYALADVLSRKNALNGLYRKIGFPLDWENLNKKEAFYITKAADLADKIIKEAIEGEKDIDNPKIKEQLQAAFYGGTAGTWLATKQHKILSFFGLR